MSMPFYVAPEQIMKDRADYARQGIARGRSVVALRYLDGIALVAENPSPSLHKLSEIYDRIGFAAVGRYNEFESLRIAGIRYADLRGYAYDRLDVNARSLANSYAAQLGAIFSAGVEKPYEVELMVAEVGEHADGDQLYRISYDGSIFDEHLFATMGGRAESLAEALGVRHDPAADLGVAVRLAVQTLGEQQGACLGSATLEVAVLDRTRPQSRKFHRLSTTELDALLVSPSGESVDG